MYLEVESHECWRCGSTADSVDQRTAARIRLLLAAEPQHQPVRVEERGDRRSASAEPLADTCAFVRWLSP